MKRTVHFTTINAGRCIVDGCKLQADESLLFCEPHMIQAYGVRDVARPSWLRRLWDRILDLLS